MLYTFMRNFIVLLKQKSSGKRFWVLGGLVFVGLFLGGLADQVNPFLGFQRSAIAEGEVWRLLSANLTHLNFNHALMNMAALALVFFMFSEVSVVLWLVVIFLLSLFVCICLYFIDTHLQGYVGLSGALYGLWVFGALATLKRNLVISLAVVSLMLFTVFQQQSQSFDTNYLQSWIGGHVIVNAHLYGLIGGVFLGALKLIQTLFLEKHSRADSVS